MYIGPYVNDGGDVKDNDWNPGAMPAMLVSRCAHLLSRQNDARFRALGLSANQLPVLVQLKDGSARTQRELAHFAGVEQPSMAELLKRMERDGLIVREANPADKRSSLIRLADDVLALIGPARAAMSEGNAEALADFSAEEIETLTVLLRRMIANIGGDQRWLADPTSVGMPSGD
jgi:MarR family transcriptional regulator, transcriptional regulator for hemolysin